MSLHKTKKVKKTACGSQFTAWVPGTKLRWAVWQQASDNQYYGSPHVSYKLIFQGPARPSKDNRASPSLTGLLPALKVRFPWI